MGPAPKRHAVPGQCGAVRTGLWPWRVRASETAQQTGQVGLGCASRVRMPCTEITGGSAGSRPPVWPRGSPPPLAPGFGFRRANALELHQIQQNCRADFFEVSLWI